MELKLNVYTNKKLLEIEKTYTASDFKLSLGTCEDVLNLINIDMFAGGLDALDDTSKGLEIMKMIIGSFGTFKEIFKDIFDGLTDDEIARTDVEDFVPVVMGVVSYAFNKLVGSLGKRKN